MSKDLCLMEVCQNGYDNSSSRPEDQMDIDYSKSCRSQAFVLDSVWV